MGEDCELIMRAPYKHELLLKGFTMYLGLPWRPPVIWFSFKTQPAFVQTWQCIASTVKQFFSLSEAFSCCRNTFYLCSGSFCSVRTHWKDSVWEKRLHTPWQITCYSGLEIEPWLILVGHLWLVLTNSDVVRNSLVSSISGELAVILPILSAIPSSFSDLGTATQECPTFSQAPHLCVLQVWHAIASLSVFSLFYIHFNVFDCHQYAHYHKLRSSKEHINWFIGHFHPDILRNVQIFRGPLPAYIGFFCLIPRS